MRTQKELRIFFRNSFLFSSRITLLFITFAANFMKPLFYIAWQM
ncbi:hypothetical protein HMPREF2534_03366 [Bacteroides thetaiotaomicron]|nr:hypothetical protein HMPREF2534_03366 [Bacteroides thetaiotaomicron]